MSESTESFSVTAALGSTLWCSVNRLARVVSRARPSVRLPVRTISVGNLEAGGVGKTPIVVAIANEAIKRGETVAILTRGYRSAWERVGGILLPGEPLDGLILGTPACGDEAALIHERVPQAWVGIGADREQSWQAIQSRVDAAHPSPTLVILDDGFQHWKIERDLDVVLVTEASPWTRLFRDWPGVIPASALVIWTKGDRPPSGISGPMVRVQLVPRPWLFKKQPSESRPLFVVCGLGQPRYFLEGLRDEGWSIGSTQLLEDHADFDPGQIQTLRARAQVLGFQLAISGKDWVKWRRNDPLADEPQSAPLVFEPELRFLDHEILWKQRLWDSA